MLDQVAAFPPMPEMPIHVKTMVEDSAEDQPPEPTTEEPPTVSEEESSKTGDATYDAAREFAEPMPPLSDPAKPGA